MKLIKLILLSFPLTVLAGNYQQAKPTGTVTNGIKTNTQSLSESKATNQGVQNSTKLEFNSESSGTIKSVPGVGTVFLTAAGERICQGSAGASVTVIALGVNGATTYTVIPCALLAEAELQINAGMAAMSNGTNFKDPQLVEDGRALFNGGATLVSCGFKNSYLYRQAMKLPCPIRPKNSPLDAAPGGMIREVVEINPNYVKPTYVPAALTKETLTPEEVNTLVNRKLDNLHRIHSRK